MDIHRQVRAYIFAHGGCPDEIPVDDMRSIELMYADGMIGQKAVLLALSSLTTGNLNSKIQKTAKPFTMKDILPTVHDYIVPPLTPEQQREQANRQMLAFLQSRPGAEAFLEKANGN